jgi:hypothetical protein
LFIPFAGGDRKDNLLGLVHGRIFRPAPLIHFNEHSKRHPGSPFVAVEQRWFLAKRTINTAALSQNSR